MKKKRLYNQIFKTFIVISGDVTLYYSFSTFFCTQKNLAVFSEKDSAYTDIHLKYFSLETTYLFQVNIYRLLINESRQTWSDTSPCIKKFQLM